LQSLISRYKTLEADSRPISLNEFNPDSAVAGSEVESWSSEGVRL